MSPLVNLLLFGASGLLMIALAIPMILGRVPPNPLYGLRCRETLADPVVWYRANAVSGRWLAALGASLIVLAACLAVVPRISAEAQSLICTAWLLVGVLWLAAASMLLARRIAAERARDEPSTR